MQDNELGSENLPVEEVYIERDVKQETPDGIQLNSTVYRPALSDQEPVPAVINRSIYGIPEDVVARGWYLDDAFVSKALAKGYAVVYQSTRGTAKSDGEFNWADDEVEDGANAIRWLAERPWCNGNVGMFGGSSRGLAMMLAAAGNPEELKAINPMASPCGGGDGSITGGALETNSFIPWTMKLASLTANRLHQNDVISEEVLAEIQSSAMNATERTTELASFHPMLHLPDHIFQDVDLPDGVEPKDLIPLWEAWLTLDGDSEYWESIDPMYMYDKIDVPALHVTGWFDSMGYGTISNYQGMRQHTDEDQFLVVGPYHHMNIGQTDCMGEIDFGPSASLTGLTFSGFAEMQVEFFNIYMKGKDPQKGSMFHPDESSVHSFRMNPKGGDWVTLQDWPDHSTNEVAWYLTTAMDSRIDDGSLSAERPNSDEDPDSYTHDPNNPVPSVGGALSCRTTEHQPGVQDVLKIHDRPDVVTYTSPPLDETLELAGSGRVTLHCETEGSGTDFYARLSHLTSDGRALNLTDGIKRTDWTRPVPNPNEQFKLDIPLWHTHYQIPSGDRLRLEIASSSVPRFDPHPGETPAWETEESNVRPVEQTIYHDQDRPSSVTFACR
jgi:putative CocE/NonD family hydrolase